MSPSRCGTSRRSGTNGGAISARHVYAKAQGESEGEPNIATSQEQRREIGLQLAVVARQMRNQFDRRVAAIGVTRSQWQMIALVSRNPGATQRMIAEMLEITEASAGRLVDRLVCDGLLERRSREDDRRAHAVYLTSSAEPLLADLAAAATVMEEKMFKGFSEEEKERLSHLLERANANLNDT